MNFTSTLWNVRLHCGDNETKQASSWRTTGISRSGSMCTTARRFDQYGYYNYEQVRNDPGYGTRRTKRSGIAGV